MFPHTVTIYNKYKDGSTEKWQRTVLEGVFWDSSKGAIMRKAGVTAADGLQLIIPLSVDSGIATYMKPKAWAALEVKSENWTIQSGDVVVLGDIAYEVVTSSKELQAYDDVMIVSNVDTRDYGGEMAHYEVTGK